MENLNKKFMNEVAEIKNPVLFLGIARILKVKIYRDNEEEVDFGVESAKASKIMMEELKKRKPREFTDIFADVMFAYDKVGRKFKKELLKILRDANKVKGDVNGDFAEDTQKTTSDENL